MRAFVSRLSHVGEQYLVVSRPLSRPGAFQSLTPAELQVAEGLLEGLSIRELASRRSVSQRTIANQTARLYRKLGVNARHELVSLVASA